MKLYPVSLRLNKTNCVVFGGGKVAWRKVKSLIKCEAKVTVVSPLLCKALKLLCRDKAFKYIKSVYRKKFLKSVFLVIAATNDEHVNRQIANDSFKRSLLVNVVDRPELCNFYIPSVIRKDSLIVSIATDGNFPGLAKLIRKGLSTYIYEYADLLKTLSGMRAELKLKIKDKNLRRKLIKKLLAPQILKLIKTKKIRRLADIRNFQRKIFLSGR